MIKPDDILNGSDLDDLYELMFDEYLMDNGGECTHSRVFTGTNNTAQVNQSMKLAGFRCKRSRLVSTITICSGTTAAVPTPTLIRFGFYHKELDGVTYTLIGSTVNDITLFAAANQAYPKGLTTPVNKVRGDDYAVGCLVVSPAALPSLLGPPLQIAATNTLFGITNPLKSGQISGLSDLPASFNISSVIASGAIHSALLT